MSITNWTFAMPNPSARSLLNIAARFAPSCTLRRNRRMIGRPYRVFGYKGKQVRDNIHSFDLVETFAAFIDQPRVAEVYNMGGGRFCNCSMLEAISLCEEISGRKLSWHYEETNRIGDHIWWISDVRKFQSHYPQWKFRFGLREILEQIFRAIKND